MNREAERFVYTESTALLTALDWTGSDGIGTPSDEVGFLGAGRDQTDKGGVAMAGA